MFPFYTPLKIAENQRFCGIFRGYKIEILTGNGLSVIKACGTGSRKSVLQNI